MSARRKMIVLIVLFWIVLLGGILSGSKYIFDSSFKQLETDSAIDVNNRIYHVILQDLKYLHFVNVDNAFWDEMHQFALKSNPKFEEVYLSNGEILTDNDVNILVILNRNNKIIWSRAYDLVKGEMTQLPASVSTYLKTNAYRFLKDKEQHHNLVKKEHGLAGFFFLPGEKYATYLSISYIHDARYKEPYSGALIFLRHLTPQFMKKLSIKFQYKIQLFTMAQLRAHKRGQRVLLQLKKHSRVYVDASNAQYLRTYRYIYDITHKPIAVLRVDIKRDMFNNVQTSSTFHEIVLLILSLVAIIGMCILVNWFFSKQERLMNSFERFVPKRFLALLDKSDILDVNLGDSDEKELSVLFLDIRNFTSLSEQMTPDENFEFINHFLNHQAPIISKHNGYIDKFIGDAIMAIFPRLEYHVDDAVNAALDMLDTLHMDNLRHNLGVEFEIGIGIGINSGKLMLGVIGSEGRLAGTVIGDTVNEASRIEGLTKLYSSALLISESAKVKLKNKDDYVIEYVDEVKVKGKRKASRVYSIKRRES